MTSAQKWGGRQYPVDRPAFVAPVYSTMSGQRTSSRQSYANRTSLRDLFGTNRSAEYEPISVAYTTSGQQTMTGFAATGGIAMNGQQTMQSFAAMGGMATTDVGAATASTTDPVSGMYAYQPQTVEHFSGFVIPVAAEQLQGGVTTSEARYRGGIRRLLDDDDMGDEETGPGYEPADPKTDDKPYDDPIGPVPLMFFVILSAIYIYIIERKRLQIPKLCNLFYSYHV